MLNLTINRVNENTKCYMWHESGGLKRRCKEITSCLYKHLCDLDATIKHVILKSGCCTGQNKKKIVAEMLSGIISSYASLQIIDHKFLKPDHTHMRRFTSTAPARGARAPNRAISNSCL